MENSRLREAAPTAVNVTVGKRSREYLTDREVERLIEAAKQNRSGHREVIELKEFEPKIQRLLDDHVTAKPATTIITTVNINDPDALKAVVKEEHTSDASKADRIASAAKRKDGRRPGFLQAILGTAGRNDSRLSGEADFRTGLPQQCGRSGQPDGTQRSRPASSRQHQRR